MSENTTTTSYTPDNLLAGLMHRVTEGKVDLTAAGSDLTYLRGTVLALNSVTDKLVPYVLG